MLQLTLFIADIVKKKTHSSPLVGDDISSCTKFDRRSAPEVINQGMWSFKEARIL